MNFSSIIILIVGAALAFIPAKIASDKGYSKGGFFAYGLFFFLPALIHALTLPSRQDPTKKQFSPRALKCLIAATILLQLNFIIDFGNSVASYFAISNVGVLSVIFTLMKIVLLISVILGRKYILSMVICGLYAASGVHNIIYSVIEGIKYAGEDYAKTYAFMAGAAVFSTLAYALLFFVVYKYAFKANEYTGSKPKILFYAPAVLLLISGVLNYMSYPYMASYTAVLTIIVLVLYFLSFFFLGRFYYEDV